MRVAKDPEHYELNEDLAEFIGIFIGDGSLDIRENKHSHEFRFTGNMTDEIPYFDTRVSKLASKILNRDIKTKIRDKCKVVEVYFCSKNFAKYLKSLGFSSGAKSGKVVIPEKIYENEDLFVHCIRGVFDTDGCFTVKRKTYPVIAFGVKSKKLIIQLKSLLEKININCCVCLDSEYFDKRTNKIYVKNYLFVNGKKNVQKWFDKIGSNNPKINMKYSMFKERISKKI